MRKAHLTGLLFSAAALSGCGAPPGPVDYANRGAPEGLLDTSSQVVNVPLAGRAGIERLAGWIDKEQPSRADLRCAEGDAGCDKAKSVLDQFSVPYAQKAADGRGPMVTLHYEHVVARNCDNRYTDNSFNPYNLNYSAFGCSVATNMVQSVADKRQFVAPPRMDYPDAEKAAQNYRESYINADQQQTIAPPAAASSLVTGAAGVGSGGGPN